MQARQSLQDENDWQKNKRVMPSNVWTRWSTEHVSADFKRGGKDTDVLFSLRTLICLRGSQILDMIVLRGNKPALCSVSDHHVCNMGQTWLLEKSVGFSQCFWQIKNNFSPTNLGCQKRRAVLRAAGNKPSLRNVEVMPEWVSWQMNLGSWTGGGSGYYR